MEKYILEVINNSFTREEIWNSETREESYVKVQDNEIASKRLASDFRAFMEWFVEDRHDIVRCRRDVYVDQFTNNEYTLDSLFNFWLDNIKKK